VYALYSVARNVTAGGSARAVANARGLLHAEQAAHLSPERWLNHVVSSRPWLAVPADYDYASLHYLVTPAVLIWLWRKHPAAYLRARRTLVAATLLGLLGFVTMPLAPPRMMPGYIDTMARFGHDGWWGSAASAPKGMGSLTNQFAAMPSLHVGWALWCGWMLVANARRTAVRVLGMLYPISTALVVLSTANHYLADVAGGVVVLVCGAVLAHSRRLRHAETPEQTARLDAAVSVERVRAGGNVVEESRTARMPVEQLAGLRVRGDDVHAEEPSDPAEVCLDVGDGHRHRRHLEEVADRGGDVAGGDALFADRVHARSRWGFLERQPHHDGGVVTVHGRPPTRAVAHVARDSFVLRDLRQGRREAVVADAVDCRGEAQRNGAHALVGVIQGEVLAAAAHGVDAVERRRIVLGERAASDP
jgi:hypothetical protein